MMNSQTSNIDDQDQKIVERDLEHKQMEIQNKYKHRQVKVNGKVYSSIMHLESLYDFRKNHKNNHVCTEVCKNIFKDFAEFFQRNQKNNIINLSKSKREEEIEENYYSRCGLCAKCIINDQKQIVVFQCCHKMHLDCFKGQFVSSYHEDKMKCIECREKLILSNIMVFQYDKFFEGATTKQVIEYDVPMQERFQKQYNSIIENNFEKINALKEEKDEISEQGANSQEEQSRILEINNEIDSLTNDQRRLINEVEKYNKILIDQKNQDTELKNIQNQNLNQLKLQFQLKTEDVCTKLAPKLHQIEHDVQPIREELNLLRNTNNRLKQVVEERSKAKQKDLNEKNLIENKMRLDGESVEVTKEMIKQIITIGMNASFDNFKLLQDKLKDTFSRYQKQSKDLNQLTNGLNEKDKFIQDYVNCILEKEFEKL